MRLREALKDYRATYVLAEATLARMRLTDEAAVATTDANHAITGAVVACDKGLVVFTVDGPQSVQASVHAWRDVSPPELTATTEEKLEATVMMVQVRLKRPPIKIGTLPFDLGVVEWAISSTATAVDFGGPAWSTPAKRDEVSRAARVSMVAPTRRTGDASTTG